MSSLLRPVGGQPAGVYWRRRLLLLVALVIVLLLVGRACDWYGGSSPVAATTPSTSPLTTGTPTTTPTTNTSPTTTPTRSTATTSPAATSRSTTGAAACTDSEVRVFVTVGNTQNPVGGPVVIRYVVTTTSDTLCQRDVGPAKDEVVITSSGRRIWSSDDCAPGGAPDVRQISKSTPYTITVIWQGDVSRPGCPTARPKAPAGDYSVTGRNGAVTSSPASFTLG